MSRFEKYLYLFVVSGILGWMAGEIHDLKKEVAHLKDINQILMQQSDRMSTFVSCRCCTTDGNGWEAIGCSTTECNPKEETK